MSVRGGPTPPIEAIPKACKDWCCTEVKTSNFSYAWIIKTFSLCRQQTGQCILSSIFSFDKTKWRLKLYPNGFNKEQKDYLSLYLMLVSSRRPVTAKFKFSILNAKQDKGREFNSENPYFFRNGVDYGFGSFILREETNDLLIDDKLSLVCEISIIGDAVSTAGQSHCTPVQVPECRLGEELGNLLENSAPYSDAILYVGDQEFPVHRNIITARSPVFAKMFEQDMIEKQTHRVEITDVNPQVMREILTFIYTGGAPHLDQMPFKLLAAADKYDLKRLKAMCEEALCSDLQVDNACEILAFADLHSADGLKSRAIDFIGSHATAVKDSAQSFSKNVPI